jgi:hypothetical protein
MEIWTVGEIEGRVLNDMKRGAGEDCYKCNGQVE